MDINLTNTFISKNARNGTQCQHILEITAEYILCQMFGETTHHTEDTESLIHLFMTTYPLLAINTIHMPGLCVCKHDSISLEIDSYHLK